MSTGEQSDNDMGGSVSSLRNSTFTLALGTALLKGGTPPPFDSMENGAQVKKLAHGGVWVAQ